MLRSTLLVILFAFSGAAFADFNYNAVTLAYGQADFDDIDADGDSIGADLSFEVGESFFVFAGYGVADLDDNFGNSADVDSWNAGLGYHMDLSESVDLVTSLSYEYVDISVPGFGSVDDNGIGLGLGLRFAASESIELNAGINYLDYSDGGDDTSFGAGLLYNFNDSFSVGVAGDFGDDVSVYSIGGRFYFGQ
jgi:opacity protein-like surface antigen